ncbi:unnamed protein product, partial [Polarella glacialis]
PFMAGTCRVKPPQCLGEFAVDFTSPIGMGACGSVFAGRHLETNCEVAIKTMSRALLTAEAGGPQVEAGIKNESEVFERVLLDGGMPHPNVVEVMGFFDGQITEATEKGLKLCHDELADESVHYFVMELLEGGSLQDHLDQHGAMKEDEAQQLTRSLCEGLASLHEKGIVHRDVKPGNVLFRKTCGSTHGDIDLQGPKLIDFSHAVIMPAEGILTGESGTRGYVAPEILADKGYGPKCDVFSLGCVLHAMLTGGRLPKRHARVGMVTRLPSSVSPEAWTCLGLFCICCCCSCCFCYLLFFCCCCFCFVFVVGFVVICCGLVCDYFIQAASQQTAAL